MNKHIRGFGFFFFVMVGIIVPRFVAGQEIGIKFETGLSWQEILKKAKTENKYIFVDCYTTWCGPCKWMSKNIFPQKEVGDYFNAHFINVAIQMDQTGKDSQAVKDWYDQAKDLSGKYAITSYPTYLFFSPDGTALHRVAGSTRDAAEFIARGTDALDSNRQYYTKINNLSSHNKDSAFLYNAMNDAVKISDTASIRLIGQHYVTSQKNLFTKGSLWVVGWLVILENSSSGEWFNFYRRNVTKINEIQNDESSVQSLLGKIIANEEIGILFERSAFPIDWKIVSVNIKTKYPDLGEGFFQLMQTYFKNFIANEINKSVNSGASTAQVNWNKFEKDMHHKIHGFNIEPILLDQEVRFWARKRSWTQCAEKSYELIRKYGDSLGSYAINNICWYNIFLHCNDKKILNESLKCMKHYIDLDSDRQENIDTYANLLFKTDNKNEAIQWEKKAIVLAERNKQYWPQDLVDFKKALQNMEAGIPTWPTDAPNTK